MGHDAKAGIWAQALAASVPAAFAIAIAAGVGASPSLPFGSTAAGLLCFSLGFGTTCRALLSSRSEANHRRSSNATQVDDDAASTVYGALAPSSAEAEAVDSHTDPPHSSVSLAVRLMREQLAPHYTPTVEEAERFLAAKQGDTISAAKTYRDFMAWRRHEHIDEVLHEPPLAERMESILRLRYNPMVLNGDDRAGRPVLYIHFGKVDVPVMVSAT